MLTFYLLYVYEEKDKPQFEALYKKYSQQFLSISNLILGNSQDAEDAAQEAWIAIANHMHIIRRLEDEKIEIYIFKIIKNKSIDLYNKKKKDACVFHLDSFAEFSDPDIEPTQTCSEDATRILDCLTRMKDCYRDVLTLYFLHEMKPAQIASSLGRPLQTVKSQLQRGKALLRDAIGESKT